MFFNKKTSDFCDLSIVEGGVPVTPNPNILDGGSHNILENYDQCTVPPVPPPLHKSRIGQKMTNCKCTSYVDDHDSISMSISERSIKYSFIVIW